MKTFPNSRFSQEDLDRVREVLATNFSASHPPRMCSDLEELWAEKIGVKYAVTFSSGTATLHGSLNAVCVGRGDEVIVPALGPLMTANAVVMQGATPVFVDVDERTFNINPEHVEKALTDNTQAIIPVSLYGLPANFGEIMKIAEEHGLAVIEDDAQSPFASFNGEMLGTIGDIASFSFESSKIFACGEGGIVTSNQKCMYDRCRAFRNHGFRIGLRQTEGAKDIFQNPDFKRHSSFGWAYRMPEVACAILISQVERFSEIVELRQQIGQMYNEVVEDCAFMTPQAIPVACEHVFWTFAVKLEKPKRLWRRFRKRYIKNGGDGVYACWSVPYLEPVYAERQVEWSGGRCVTAEAIQPQIMQFPTNYGSIEEATPKMEALRKTLREFRI